MSVTATVTCPNCKSYGPDIGDCGHLGYPALVDSASVAGGLASFEWLYRGYAAVGWHFLELDRLRHWITEHAAHSVHLAYEGERIRLNKRLPLARVTMAEPAVGDYPRSVLELRCQTCVKTARSQQALFVRSVDRAVREADVDAFEKRVVDAPGENFYRTFQLLDPGSADFQAMWEFLRAHRRHRLRVRTIQNETWASAELPQPSPSPPMPDVRDPYGQGTRVAPRASLAPPLEIRWTFAAAVKPPVIAYEGRIITLVDRRSTVVALDHDGREIWRSCAFAPHALWVIHAAGGRLFLPHYRTEDHTYLLHVLDDRDGRLLGSIPNAAHPVAYLDDGTFIGHRREADNVEVFGRFRPGERGLDALWSIQRQQPAGDFLGFLGARAVHDGGQVYLDWGTHVYALGLKTGTTVWDTDLGGDQRRAGYVGAHHSIRGDRLVASRSGKLHGFDARDGRVIWQVGHDAGRLPRGTSEHTVVTAGQLSSEPGKHASLITGIDVHTGAVQFQQRTDQGGWMATPKPIAAISTHPVIVDECVYVADTDGRLWATVQGQPVWMTTLPGCAGWPHEIVTAAQGMLLLTDNAGTLFCMGTAASRRSLATSLPASSRGSASSIAGKPRRSTAAPAVRPRRKVEKANGTRRFSAKAARSGSKRRRGDK